MPKVSCGPHILHRYIDYMRTHTENLPLFASQIHRGANVAKPNRNLPPPPPLSERREKKTEYFQWISFRDFILYSSSLFFRISFASMQNVEGKKLLSLFFLFRFAYNFVLLNPALQVPHKSLNFQHNRNSVRVD